MKTLLYSTFITLLLLTSCQGNSQTQDQKKATLQNQNITPVQTKPINGIERAYFASGCFWCVEAIYESVKGVKEVVSGYSGGHTENPTYESSNTGRTGHAEAVEVLYDPKIVSFSSLVDVYFGSQNPTQINGQGPDRGSQYRSIIFYQNDNQKNIIQKKKDLLGKTLNRKIAAEVTPFQKFWKAEGYHQDYEKRNPYNRYIQNVSIPRLKRFHKKFPELIKEIH
ncbi:peptide-methionine (S)-S-oxide reductase [Aquimarina sp. BL5]|uniref:peptide-methionine (S)-S-oxide reductase MsrA n=1 Tax=Aquimarina sp. BL5 TaxID=1714860 RepID=UPI000E52E7DF|nr:peptide-methionine (S)-S-oxide reductase MsrA [Aquimarina sp. BL5]AXT53016.1 peptide-methionine (S)-S-oxide reductase [Aquimarina sp. BL5]RKN07343.1 peptide-methionine (S)-S-oxide reductase [Aquimarina sp. BL5]